VSNALAGEEAVAAEKVLARLVEAGRRGVELDETWDRLGGDGVDGPADVEAALRRLETEGKALLEDGRWIAVDTTGGAVGTVELQEKGDAVLQSGGGPAFFIGRRHLEGALDGDTVLVQPLGRRRPRGHWLPEAKVVRVLKRRYDTLVGTTDLDEQGRRWLSPYDPKVSIELEVTGAEDDLPETHFVVVAVERVPGARTPRGRIVEVLGDPEVPGVDVLVVLRHFGIPEGFPAEVEAAANALPEDPEPEHWEGREDLRGRIVFTIDGEKARDFDDAVSIEPLAPAAGGVYRLGVHIADVSHYVAEGTALDREAYRRGTSVYYPERAIPMLPEGLSNGLCSLRPLVPRLTLSAFLDIGPEGEVRARRFAETVIQSSRRLTYTEVRRLLEEPHPGDRNQYGGILDALAHMRKLMEIRLRARTARGSIDFDLPEGNVELDTDGLMVGIIAGERNIAHRIVEEFMIAANEAVAEALDTAQSPALYRVHGAPSPPRLAELRELLRPLGFDLPDEPGQELHPVALQEILREAQGRPEEQFVSTVVLRSLQRAVYRAECLGHYALASRYYTHFTSPIRRYPDLVVHRRLKALIRLGDREDPEVRVRLTERLPAVGEHTSTTERRSEQSERDLLQWKKVRFLSDRVGETFPGRITGVQAFGLFVQLDGYYVDGLVPIRTLGDEYFRHVPEAHQLVGESTGRTFQLGDPVEVLLAGVDRRRRGLEFRIGGEDAVRARERPIRDRGGRDRDDRKRAEGRERPTGRSRTARPGGASRERPGGGASRPGGGGREKPGGGERPARRKR
jgi:ribonuclease R